MKRFLHPFITLAFCLLAQHVFAQRILLRADGFTRGGSSYEDYKDYVEIQSKQFGVTHEVSAGSSDGALAFQNLVITKFSDKLSNRLLDLLVTRNIIDEMEILTVEAVGKDGRLSVVNKIELRGVRVESFASSAVAGCETGCEGIGESYKFVYNKIRITTFTQNQKGVLATDPFVFMYDVENNRVAF